MKTFIFFLIIVCSLSCEDFLDKEPELEVSVNEQFSTFNGAVNAMQGAYQSMREIMRGRFFLYADLMGGNIKFAPDNDGDIEVNALTGLEPTYNLNYDVFENDFSATYTAFYQIINNVNQILENLESVPEITENEASFLRAEALAMRAWTHFELYRMFAQHYSFTGDASHLGVVYNTEVLGIGDFPSRLTSAETFNQIIEDFNQSLSLYDSSDFQYNSEFTKSYMSPEFVNAMLSRVYLYTENYNEAISSADRVLNSGNYSLLNTDNYVEQWLASLPHSEIILELTPNFSGEDPAITNLALFYNPLSNQNARFSTSNDLLELYSSTDVRRQNSMFLTLEINTNIGENNTQGLLYHYTKKFQDDTSTSREGTPIIRLSEVILNKAESQLQSNNLSGAITTLNELRSNRDTNAQSLDGLTAEELAEEIFNERRRELCFENHLFFDIARLQKDVVRDEGCISLQCNLVYPNFRYAQPIPRGSVNVNSNLEQNEGY